MTCQTALNSAPTWEDRRCMWVRNRWPMPVRPTQDLGRLGGCACSLADHHGTSSCETRNPACATWPPGHRAGRVRFEPGSLLKIAPSRTCSPGRASGKERAARPPNRTGPGLAGLSGVPGMLGARSGQLRRNRVSMRLSLLDNDYLAAGASLASLVG